MALTMAAQCAALVPLYRSTGGPPRPVAVPVAPVTAPGTGTREERRTS
ncbi:hypothetical protein [Streptomyces laurentii]